MTSYNMTHRQAENSRYVSIRRVFDGGVALWQKGNLEGALELFLDASERCYRRSEALNGDATDKAKGEMRDVVSLSETLEGMMEQVLEGMMEQVQVLVRAGLTPAELVEKFPYPQTLLEVRTAPEGTYARATVKSHPKG